MSTLPEPFQFLVDVHRRVVGEFMTRRNVIAVGLGYKVSSGLITPIPSIVVSVRRKHSLDELDEEDIIPPQVDNVLTDVVETGDIRALGFNRQTTVRPVRPGLSIGHFKGTAGTAGPVVERGGELLLLSNNHVVAQLNTGRPGDAILQPGPADGGTLADAFGELADYVPISFLEAVPEGSAIPEAMAQPQAQTEAPAGCAALIARLLPQPGNPDPPQRSTNLVDAGLVRPRDPMLLDPNIVDIGAPPLGLGEAALGGRVIKSGRTTGLTQGIVTQVDVTVDVNFDGRVARYVNQIMATPFSNRGDSGSLVLDAERRAVGLIFSGSEVVSVFNPLDTVLESLNLTLVTS